MSQNASFPPELNALVRDALAHLYDHAHLENHPLAAMLDAAAGNLDRVSRAQRIRRLLLDCIEALKPQGDAPSEATRAYAILSYHYVDGLTMPAVAKSLALSRRQAYREHEKGIKAVARLVWDRVGLPTANTTALVSPTPGGRINLAQTEVNRLQQTARSEPLDLAEIVRGVIETLRPLCQSCAVQIHMQPTDARLNIVGSRTLLRQAILNLLSHGVKTVRGDLIVQVSWLQDGCLIEMCGAVAGSTAGSDVPESDIGLAVARGLISAQGGCLDTHREKGQWTARLWLPSSGRSVVLVIDDNRDIVALLRRYLGGHDVTVVSATNGEQALRLATELRPHLITLDVMMPDVDGWEILQQLKTNPAVQHIPVIVCSVLNEPQLAQAMGASDYVTKPISQDEFLQVLRRWLPLCERTTLPGAELPAESPESP